MADDTPRFPFSSMPDLHSQGGLKDLSQGAVQQVPRYVRRASRFCGCNDQEGQFRTGVAGMTPLDVMWVGLGGGLGSLLRRATGRLVGEHYHGDLPAGTFLINVSGAFAIGYLSVLFKVDWRDRYGTALNAGVLTGVLGGYTTFSSMQLDAVKLAGKRGGIPAVTYLLVSVLVGQLAAALGGTLAGTHG
jgi:fluoride exporter